MPSGAGHTAPLGGGSTHGVKQMPLYNPVPNMAGPLGFFGATPITQPGVYSWGYATSNRALASYTTNSQSGAYLGGLLDLLQAARLSDLNTLRVAVENLRVFTESVAQQHNAMALDMKALGLINGV